MSLSVILATYNSPEWLEKVLWGYAAQDTSDFEIVIADDGSGPETRALIDRMSRETDLTITHVWHEDRGFRKCEILNKAILASAGDYLVFSDGDCIPRRDLLAQHQRLRRPGHFLSGGHVSLPLSISTAITPEHIRTGRVADATWLRSQGLKPTRKMLRLLAGSRLGRVFDAVTPTRPTWNGGNASAWREDLLAANGYDERMVWGGLDRELGERLENAGVRGVQIRHRAVVVHLDHPRGYASEEGVRGNAQIREQTRRTRRTRTEYGLDRHREAELIVHRPGAASTSM
ncbi:MAG: glycosyltransferase family 2 protein [Gemmatimonadota bacterium]|nr:MAG: glycosyltransferase family 2 protein [Gemmatimonadota bacterium]